MLRVLAEGERHEAGIQRRDAESEESRREELSFSFQSSATLCALCVSALKRPAAMHENEISTLIIGAAIEVHRYHGPGLVEQVYEESLCHEFSLRHIPFKRQQPMSIYYKGVKLGSDLALDLIVYDKVIVDNKAKDEIHPLDKVKLLTYLRLVLLINFHAAVLKDGIFRS